MVIRISFLILIIAFSSVALGADYVSHAGKVTRVVAFPHSYGSYNETKKGLVAIYVEGLPKGCVNGQSRVVIGVDHPLHDSVLSIALMAKASKSEVTIAYFNECTIRSESWDFAYLAINE